MNKNKNNRSGQEGNNENIEITQLNRKLRDLEDMCAKLKKSNETMKHDYDKHKSKLSKVNNLA